MEIKGTYDVGLRLVAGVDIVAEMQKGCISARSAIR